MLQVVTTAGQLRSVTEIATSVTTVEIAWDALNTLKEPRKNHGAKKHGVALLEAPKLGVSFLCAHALSTSNRNT